VSLAARVKGKDSLLERSSILGAFLDPEKAFEISKWQIG